MRFPHQSAGSRSASWRFRGETRWTPNGIALKVRGVGIDFQGAPCVFLIKVLGVGLENGVFEVKQGGLPTVMPPKCGEWIYAKVTL